MRNLLNVEHNWVRNFSSDMPLTCRELVNVDLNNVSLVGETTNTWFGLSYLKVQCWIVLQFYMSKTPEFKSLIGDKKTILREMTKDAFSQALSAFIGNAADNVRAFYHHPSPDNFRCKQDWQCTSGNWHPDQESTSSTVNPENYYMKLLAISDVNGDQFADALIVIYNHAHDPLGRPHGIIVTRLGENAPLVPLALFPDFR